MLTWLAKLRHLIQQGLIARIEAVGSRSKR
jgi:hypothetical protein